MSDLSVHISARERAYLRSRPGIWTLASGHMDGFGGFSSNLFVGASAFVCWENPTFARSFHAVAAEDVDSNSNSI